jgi:hypothetical protein
MHDACQKRSAVKEVLAAAICCTCLLWYTNAVLVV